MKSLLFAVALWLLVNLLTVSPAVHAATASTSSPLDTTAVQYSFPRAVVNAASGTVAVTFRLEAPHSAQDVLLHTEGFHNFPLSAKMLPSAIPLTKSLSLFSITLRDVEYGLQYYWFSVDGMEVRDPGSRVAYAFGRHVNVFEVPSVNTTLTSFYRSPTSEPTEHNVVKDATASQTHDAPLVLEWRYFSTKLVTWRRARVLIFRQPYTTSQSRGVDGGGIRIDLLYLLHGAGQNGDAWINEGKLSEISQNYFAERTERRRFVEEDQNNDAENIEEQQHSDYYYYWVAVTDCCSTVSDESGGCGGSVPATQQQQEAPPTQNDSRKKKMMKVEYTEVFWADLVPSIEGMLRKHFLHSLPSSDTEGVHFRRALAGLSRGGLQALKIAATLGAKEFHTVGSFSMAPQVDTAAMTENGGSTCQGDDYLVVSSTTCCPCPERDEDLLRHGATRLQLPNVFLAVGSDEMPFDETVPEYTARLNATGNFVPHHARRRSSPQTDSTTSKAASSPTTNSLPWLHSTTYSGGEHEWRTWRMALRDFLVAVYG